MEQVILPFEKGHKNAVVEPLLFPARTGACKLCGNLSGDNKINRQDDFQPVVCFLFCLTFRCALRCWIFCALVAVSFQS